MISLSSVEIHLLSKPSRCLTIIILLQASALAVVHSRAAPAEEPLSELQQQQQQNQESSIFSLADDGTRVFSWSMDGVSSGSGSGSSGGGSGSTSGSSDLDSWNYWWTYSGVSGPAYWGLLNLDWAQCDKGKRQSPININTNSLVYDPNLDSLIIEGDNNLISGILLNNGHSIVFNASVSAILRSVQLRNITTTTTEFMHHTHGVMDTSSSHGLSKRNSKVLDDDEVGPKLFSASDKMINTTPKQTNSLMESLNQNIELSIGQSDRLESFDLEAYTASLAANSDSGSVSKRQITETSSASKIAVGDDDLSTNQLPSQSMIGDDQSMNSLESMLKVVHFSGAGLAYKYQFEALHLHFGTSSGNPDLDPNNDPMGPNEQPAAGSEHQINGRSFAAELQIYAFNSQLYRDFTEASLRPHGLLAISVLIDELPVLSETTSQNANSSMAQTKSTTTTTTTKEAPAKQYNKQLEMLASKAGKLLHHRNQFVHLENQLSLASLLPPLDQFVTYEGSLTWPGCYESVTWLLLNRPLYLSRESLLMLLLVPLAATQSPVLDMATSKWDTLTNEKVLSLDKLRSISADEQTAAQISGTLIAGNIRPIQAPNNRPIRTNIRPPAVKSGQQETCTRLWAQYDYREKK